MKSFWQDVSIQQTGTAVSAELFANRTTEHEKTFWLMFETPRDIRRTAVTELVNHQVRLTRFALNCRRRCYCKIRAILQTALSLPFCQHVWGTLASLSCDHHDLCADNILILRSGCTVDSGWQFIMRVFHIRRSCGVKTWKTWRIFLDQTSSSLLPCSPQDQIKILSLPSYVSFIFCLTFNDNKISSSFLWCSAHAQIRQEVQLSQRDCASFVLLNNLLSHSLRSLKVIRNDTVA